MMCSGACNGTLRKAVLALVSFGYFFFSTFFLILWLAAKGGGGKVCAVSMHITVPVVYRVYKSLLTLST